MNNKLTQNFRNFYTFKSNIKLEKESDGKPFGKSIIHYEIYKRRDVTNLNSVLGYVLLLKQRIIIPNNSVKEAGPTSSTSYMDYPAILVNKIDIQANNNATILLQSIFPKTLNSSISTSSSSNDGSSTSTMQQYSSGSSSNNINTFGVGISFGFFGDLPMGSFSEDFSHSREDSKFNSTTSGISSESNTNTSVSESMSIKDWSSYGYLDSTSISPTWIWGQSYPWDVIQFNFSRDDSNIILPEFVSNRLINKEWVSPPSQLSLFGIDFTMQAAWLIDFPDGVTEDETITITHTTNSHTASHSLQDGGKFTLQSTSSASKARYSSGTLDLSSFSLHPIDSATSGNGAAIGFTANPFTYPPSSADAKFKIVSAANNVQVTGAGFDSVMTSSFKSNISMTVTFKIADTTVDYSLLLMHWKGVSSGPCKLTWTVNGKWTGILYIDSVEGNGGQNNISSIELRNTDFTSINFHDYLIIGTNKIVIDIEPVDTTKSNEYTLFALAIGQA